MTTHHLPTQDRAAAAAESLERGAHYCDPCAWGSDPPSEPAPVDISFVPLDYQPERPARLVIIGKGSPSADIPRAGDYMGCLRWDKAFWDRVADVEKRARGRKPKRRLKIFQG